MKKESLPYRILLQHTTNRAETDCQPQPIDKYIFFSDIQETNRIRPRALENAIRANS